MLKLTPEKVSWLRKVMPQLRWLSASHWLSASYYWEVEDLGTKMELILERGSFASVFMGFWVVPWSWSPSSHRLQLSPCTGLLGMLEPIPGKAWYTMEKSPVVLFRSTMTNDHMIYHVDCAASLALYRPVSGEVAGGNHRSLHPCLQHPSADSQLHQGQPRRKGINGLS